eukprot:TRINITY_DN29980_c0_g1_i1.p1 TRINITY_DN29980_c0_g1~~TRINITY_DN29980_c0_g1_i1.p1  ORF type:complete len:206 (+),score=30.69 TRINITY_DN29980_c0_g1_i1:145-762(+)
MMLTTYRGDMVNKPLGDDKINETLRQVYLTRARGPPVKNINISKPVSSAQATFARPTKSDMARCRPLPHDCTGSNMGSFMGGSFLSPLKSQASSEYRVHKISVNPKIIQHNNLDLMDGRKTDFWASNYRKEIARPRKKVGLGEHPAPGTLTFGSAPSSSKSSPDLASVLSAISAPPSSLTVPAPPASSSVVSMARSRSAMQLDLC